MGDTILTGYRSKGQCRCRERCRKQKIMRSRNTCRSASERVENIYIDVYKRQNVIVGIYDSVSASGINDLFIIYFIARVDVRYVLPSLPLANYLLHFTLSVKLITILIVDILCTLYEYDNDKTQLRIKTANKNVIKLFIEHVLFR